MKNWLTVAAMFGIGYLIAANDGLPPPEEPTEAVVAEPDADAEPVEAEPEPSIKELQDDPKPEVE